MREKQEELRQQCKFLKWNKDIKYYQIAKAIGMSEHGFYNFISSKDVDLGYTNRKKLENYIKENTTHE